jgi:hypothetical protein
MKAVMRANVSVLPLTSGSEKHLLQQEEKTMDNFKIPEELDMTQAEKSALIQVMRMMESGEMIWQPNTPGLFADETPIAAKAFNMNSAGNKRFYSDDMIGCIGFWMGIEMGLSYDDAKEYVYKQQHDTTKLRQLLWGQLDGNLKPDMVAKTIRNFLETGVVDWEIGYLTQDNH